MTKNLIDAGYPVVGYNRSTGPVDKLTEHGRDAGKSPADVAAQSDVVLLCLPDSPDVEESSSAIVANQPQTSDGLSEGW
jgi:3-hydroxyisobutyrate dehydrogenase-like beta-hydroxyacid dehydrogenase